MTDAYIEQTLIDAFLTLNEFSGIPYIERDGNGNLLNVSIPNQPFTPPADNRFFILNFLPGEPEPAGLGENAENLWSGILQIDVFVSLGAGMDESYEKLKRIYKLFGRGKVFDRVTIVKTYRATHGAVPEMGFYRTVIRVEFTCSLPKD